MATIFGLSSGSAPAGIGIIRITGAAAAVALRTLTGCLPKPRKATRCQFRSASGELLDDGLALWFPGPASVTGEDVAECHIHGSRAVIAAMERALAAMPSLRRAQPGEFTRRAFLNGRLDLSEAEGLADLLAAETEIQRQAAIFMASGRFSGMLEDWRAQLLALSAQIEASIDFDGEDTIGGLPPAFPGQLAALRSDLIENLAVPDAEMLREGFRVALAGPPNAGKSTLFNALVSSDMAIVSEIAGTTRDVLVANVAIDGIPFSFVDMAGLREQSSDPIEVLGIARAEEEIDRADLTLWLGPENTGPPDAWEIASKCDEHGTTEKQFARYYVSAVTGLGMKGLVNGLVNEAHIAMLKPGKAALNRRQRGLLQDAAAALAEATEVADVLLIAEELRLARVAIDALLGRTGTEDVLDAVFARFCLGK